MNQPIRVVIAEDYELVLQALEALVAKLGFEVAGLAKDGERLLQVVAQTRPDVVLTDVQMPVMNGIEATREMSRLYPAMGVVGLTVHDEDQLVVDMLHAGAKGFLFKDKSMEQLTQALQAASAGELYYCNTTGLRLVRRIVADGAAHFKESAEPLLSEKEVEIIRLICQEYVTKQIAAETQLSVNTVKKYRAQIMEKLGVQSVVGLVVYAMKNGLYA